jgi:flagellar basal-body rod protein FlgB
MFVGKLIETNNLLEKALSTESTRRRVIANNIANVDVPHFKRSEVNFESQLKRVVNEQNNPDRFYQAKMSDSKHIPFFVPRSVENVKSRINLDYNTTYRNDGNNVDIEKEMVDASKNVMRYNSYVSSLNHNYKLLKFVMRPM